MSREAKGGAENVAGVTDAVAARDAGAAGAQGAGARDAADAGAVGAGRFAIAFDGTRCVKCWACEVSCRQWSGLTAATPARRWVREEVRGAFPQVERAFVSEGCRHCTDAPCVAACAFGALGQRADGRVTVDAARCAGCRRCASACPHDVPRFTAAGVMDKCDGCFAAGVPDGVAPRCVATCPTGALTFSGSAGEPARPVGGAAAGWRPCASAAAPSAPGDGRAGGSARSAESAAARVSADELADAYGLLAALVMREVPAAFLAALRDNPPGAPEPLAAYARSLQGADLDQEAQELAVDFAAVLLGMSPHPVFPYESAYADDDRLLMRPVRDDVVRAYAAAGFAADPALCLPEDHLAFELAFAAHLARREADAWAAGDEAAAAQAATRRAAFERDHLGPWAPRFAADWQRASASPFYQALAQLLADLAAPA